MKTIYVLNVIDFNDTTYKNPIVTPHLFSTTPTKNTVCDSIKQQITYVEHEMLLRHGKLNLTNKLITLNSVVVDSSKPSSGGDYTITCQKGFVNVQKPLNWAVYFYGYKLGVLFECTLVSRYDVESIKQTSYWLLTSRLGIL